MRRTHPLGGSKTFASSNRLSIQRRAPWRSPPSVSPLPRTQRKGAHTMSATAPMWPAGAAYIDGRFMPIAEAMIPVTEWGYRRSDVTYDVVSVWDGAFFKLADHLKRFRASMDHYRLHPNESNDHIRGVLHELVRRTGLREAYVAMDCLRGSAPAHLRRHPSNARNYLLAFAVPSVWLLRG